MASQGVRQLLPRTRSLQNLKAILFASTGVFSYFAEKVRNFTSKNKSKVTERKGSVSLLCTVLRWFNAFTAHMHSLVFGKSCTSVSLNDNHQDVVNDVGDCGDYYHALKISCREVPKCCVEPYILKGYVLPHQPWRYYLKVLWIPNNEMLNVWTHLLPSLYFMYMLYNFYQTLDLTVKWPLLFVTISAIILTMCSALAHMFHNRSSYDHCCWFLFDYFGITCFAFSSTSAHFFACADLSYYQTIGSFNLIVFLLICFVGFVSCSLSQIGEVADSVVNGRHYKVFSNVGGYLYGMIPLITRLYGSWDANNTALNYHVLQFVFMTLSPIIYASDIPQRFWPGKFDIVGHSHQIFHIFGALGFYFDICAIHVDVTTNQYLILTSQSDHPDFSTFCSLFLILCVYCLVVGVRMGFIIKKQRINELKNSWDSSDAKSGSHKIFSCNKDSEKKQK